MKLSLQVCSDYECKMSPNQILFFGKIRLIRMRNASRFLNIMGKSINFLQWKRYTFLEKKPLHSQFIIKSETNEEQNARLEGSIFLGSCSLGGNAGVLAVVVGGGGDLSPMMSSCIEDWEPLPSHKLPGSCQSRGRVRENAF